MIRHQDGSVMHMPNDVGWSTYARVVRKPGIGWQFIGYSQPAWGSLADAVRKLPQSLDEQGTLYFASPGGQWERVG